MSSNVDIESIKEIIKKYEYGIYNILNPENQFAIEYNIPNKVHVLRNVYDLKNISFRGSCTELMNTSYCELNVVFPEYEVIRARVNEPQFFKSEKAVHWVNLVSEKKSSEKAKRIIKDISELMTKDPVLVDPCLKIVDRLSNTGYRIRSIYPEGTPWLNYNTEVVEDMHSVPLFYSQNHNLIIELMSNKESDSGLGIFLNYGTEDKGAFIDLHSENANRIKYKHDRLHALIDKLQRTKIKMTTDKDILLDPIIIR